MDTAHSTSPSAADRLLREMGVDVWRVRRQADDAGPAEAEIQPLTETETTAEADAVKAPVQPLPEPAVAPVRKAPDEGADTSTTIEPFAVVCLSREGAVLLSQPSDLKAARRFGADLLAAVTGIWGGQSDQLVFEWPQPGIDASAESMSRALGAFVIKQVGDNADGLTLVSAEVVERLGRVPVPEECLVIPAIDELMTNGDLKRTLWQEIVRRSNP